MTGGVRDGKDKEKLVPSMTGSPSKNFDNCRAGTGRRTAPSA